MNQVLFFAELREKTGVDSVDVDFNGKSIGEVKTAIQKMYGLDQLSASMVAVNEEFARKDTMVENGDTIAFIPPVSGG